MCMLLMFRIVSELMEEARTQKRDVVQDDGMQEIFMKIMENPALDMRDKKAAVIDFVSAGIETVKIAAWLFYFDVNTWISKINQFYRRYNVK